jgi:hypothetical protein
MIINSSSNNNNGALKHHPLMINRIPADGKATQDAIGVMMKGQCVFVNAMILDQEPHQRMIVDHPEAHVLLEEIEEEMILNLETRMFIFFVYFDYTFAYEYD